MTDLNDAGLSTLMPLLLVYAFAWGAIWGSFLNVVIWRLPRDMNLARPDSHCPACKAPVRWHDNIPILSWLLLRAKCRDCGTPISARYPLVELLVAILSTALFWHVAHGRLDVEPLQVILVPWLFLFYFILACVAIAFIDLDLTIIPHRITVPTIALGLVAALLTPKTGVFASFHPSVDIVDSLIGLVAGAGIILAVFKGYLMATGREGIGGGDFMMMGMIGAFLGWQSLLFVLLAASLQGLIAAIAASMLGSRRAAAQEEQGFLKTGAWKPEFWENTEAESTGGAAHATATPAEVSRPNPLPETLIQPASSEASTGEASTSVAPIVTDPADPIAGDAAAGWTSAGTAAVPHTGEDSAPEGGSGEGEGEDGEGGLMKLAIPFGPFLALAAVQYIFFGRTFLLWLGGGYLPF